MKSRNLEGGQRSLRYESAPKSRCSNPVFQIRAMLSCKRPIKPPDQKKSACAQEPQAPWFRDGHDHYVVEINRGDTRTGYDFDQQTVNWHSGVRAQQGRELERRK